MLTPGVLILKLVTERCATWCQAVELISKMADVETLLTAIKATQELRASVAHVFERLSEGMRDSNNPIGKEKAAEKAFLAELQQNLLVVNGDLR